MSLLDERRTSGNPHKALYDPDVAKVKRISVEEARKDIGRMTAQAADGNLDEHSLVTRHGRGGVVIVPIDWYRDARAALNDPTDIA